MPEIYGKEPDGDLWEGKRTVMLLHFLRVAPEGERRRALALLRQHRRDKTASEVAWLRAAMEDRGSLEHGRRLAWQYCERALAADSQPLTFFEDNEDRRFLREMLLYVVEHVK